MIQCRPIKAHSEKKTKTGDAGTTSRSGGFAPVGMIELLTDKSSAWKARAAVGVAPRQLVPESTWFGPGTGANCRHTIAQYNSN